jgi:hypothetical protein
VSSDVPSFVRDVRTHQVKKRILPSRHPPGTDVRIAAQGCVTRVHTSGDRPPFFLTIWRDHHGAHVALGEREVEIMRVPLWANSLKQAAANRAWMDKAAERGAADLEFSAVAATIGGR